MQVLENFLELMVKCLRRTGPQVPCAWIGPPPREPIVERPDDWFSLLKDRRPAVGRESGFLFMSRRGWNANAREIRRIVEQTRGFSWSQARQIADDHFTLVENNLAKEIEKAETRLRQLRQVRV